MSNKCVINNPYWDEKGVRRFRKDERHEWQCYGLVVGSLGPDKLIRHFKVCANCDTVVELWEKE